MTRTITAGYVAAGAGAVAAAAAGAIVLRRQREQHLAALVPPGQFLDVDGERIHYIDRGAGPALVLIHGLGGSTFSWRESIPALADRHRVVALDLPGLGFSERMPVWPLSLDQQARRVTRLMGSLGIDRATIVGHSMGGGIAARLAAQFPARAEKLVLVASVDPGAGEWLSGALTRGPVLAAVRAALGIPSVVRFATRQGLRACVADPAFVTPEVLRGYADPLLLPGTAACFTRLVQDIRYEHPLDLAGLSVPALVISAEADPGFPPDAGGRVAAAIPGARHVVVPGAGHLVAEEQPAVFLAHLREFLAGGASQAPRRGRRKATAATGQD
ncbi:MAG: alpha/beta fold hydrolase [Thermoflexaceae bacterium]|nr:alpha/beta fold hydrolase [Thermoflexaceae bacterium]